MQELTEAKFPRTNKEYKLEKTETGFNLRLIDLDDELKPIFKTFQQLKEMAERGEIVFAGFEEKKNEAELILLNCIHETEITNCKTEIEKLAADNEAIQKENAELKEEIETLKNLITGLKEAKELADSGQ